MKLTAFPEWRTKGGAISLLGPWLAMSLFEDEDRDHPETEGRMSFLDHLEELRTRLIISLGEIAISLIVCWIFAERIFDFLVIPWGDGKLKYLTPMEPFNVYLQVALLAAVFLASPLVLWQVWLFISPGLYAHEKKWALPFISCSTSLFMLGGAFAYKIALPLTLHFLQIYGRKFDAGVTLTAYLDFAVTIILGCAVLFEIPILIFFLSVLGLVSAGFLLKNFRYAILVICIVAAVITPTPDISTMMVFTVPMLLLYIVGIIVAWIFGKRRGDKAG
jgi:sec-independent protein translocase protein TatC